ncbi:hypothetical protein PIB30_013526 [Stylosanthes scabra]|uniref:Uncharacterized protein n=1 Tax=Stylosanthes scabra TaxID=79078 RepID=A0ABU6R5E9_9FABA|nr:hypothetical protein [Stylosanthes scabra]
MLQAKSHLGHAHLWTKIFEVAQLDMTREDLVELIRKGFEDMRTMIIEGFTRLSDRIDSLEIHMASLGADLRSLQDEFRRFRGEDPIGDDPE